MAKQLGSLYSAFNQFKNHGLKVAVASSAHRVKVDANLGAAVLPYLCTSLHISLSDISYFIGDKCYIGSLCIFWPGHLPLFLVPYLF